MAEAALDYDYFEPDESLEIPEGGIADFLTAKTGSWADDDVPSSGIAQVKHVVDQLAEYGRFDDEYMVHAAPNETVIPFPVLDANPNLRFALYAQMRALGLDPERYTVGNDLNSINPVTGQREFGFFKKIKKFFKKVVKVIKKIAPIVLPIVLAMTPLGPIYGAMLGSGLGSLVQGGSFKDALKAAAISGATAGIMKGMQGGVKAMRAARAGTGTATFGQGFTSSVGEALRPFADTATAVAAAAPTTADMAQGTELGSFLDEAVQQATPPGTTGGMQVGDVFQTRSETGPWQDATVHAVGGGQPPSQITMPGTSTSQLWEPRTAESFGLPSPPPGAPTFGSASRAAGITPTPPGVSTPSAITPSALATTTPPAGTAAERLAELKAPSFGKSIKQAFTPGDKVGFMEGMGKAFFPKGPSVAEVLKAQGIDNPTYIQMKTAEALAREQGPGMMQRLLPIYGASMLAAKVAEGFEEEEDPLFDPSITGASLYKENPEEYRVDINLPPPIEIQQWADTGVGPQTTIQWAPPGGAGGGNVDSYPPRIGGINGPGSGTSDDVPAMLSDGEFVFTAKAVKGAGNGSRKNGTSNLYSLMRNFEGRA